jgi:hypothetical protein
MSIPIGISLIFFLKIVAFEKIEININSLVWKKKRQIKNHLVKQQ